MVSEAKSLPLWRKIGYGVGDAGANFSWTFIASFIMLYCTNVLGVKAGVVGTLMMFSKFLDGVSDVIMGRIIDATHHKMGKARFWYFISIIPLAVFTFLLFNVPGSFSENTKYAYIFIVYTLIGAVFYTMNNIAYYSLTALVTKNPKDRVQMGSYRCIFAVVAVLTLSSVTSGLAERFGGGQQGWRMVALIYAVLSAILLMVPVFAVKELPESELADGGQAGENGEKLGFFQSLKMLVKNKYFLMILGIYLVYYLCTGITQGMGIFFATYQLGNPALLGTISMASTIPMILVLPVIPELTGKFGMRKAGMIGNAIALFGGIIMIIGGMGNGFMFVVAGMIIKSLGTTPMTGSLNALIAEADDYSSLKYGQRMTGTIYSCSSMGMKIGTGLGTAVCGFILDMGGFVGTAETQTAGAIATINWSYLLANAVPCLVLVIIMYFLKVEQENKELAKK